MDLFEILLAVIVPIAIILIIIGLYRRIITASPSEWMLVIENGKLKKSGIGLRVFKGLRQTIVTFPAGIYRVNFSAQQVSKEMQGVEVSGFVIWVINREGDGPFKAYKHIKELSSPPFEPHQTNENLARMAESIVRHQIANLSIEEVIKQRDSVRTAIREQMHEVVKGFGIWLETIEIADVVILSSSLFEDLQTPFRQESRRTAEKIRMNTDQELKEKRLGIDLELNKKEIDNQTSQAIYEKEQKLLEEKEEEKLFIERQKIEKAKLEHKKEIELLRIETNNEIAKQRIAGEHAINKEGTENDLELSEMRFKQEIGMLTERYKTESKLGPASLKLIILETIKQLYADMPIDSVKIMNMGPNQGLESIVAQIARAVQSTYKEMEDT